MLTHVDETTQMPTMVDVSEKTVTQRVARAQSLIQLPPQIRPFLRAGELTMKKGPVFQTAIVAGTMAAKRTSEVIPFCHQIPIESCKFNIGIDPSLLVTIECTVKTTFKTGVEMEALNGAMSAALTIYDMCKAISHDIVILETRLTTKTGGKRTVLDRPTFGLVLTGGRSERMMRDKALIPYTGVPHAQYIFDVLSKYCEEVYLSAREAQWHGTPLAELPTIVDTLDGGGPIAGILAAFEKHANANWIVTACDLVHFNHQTVQTLLANYNPASVATAFKNREKGFPEPLCALYTPDAKQIFIEALTQNVTCPVKVLTNSNVQVIEQTEGINLANVNTVEDYEEIQNEVC